MNVFDGVAISNGSHRLSGIPTLAEPGRPTPVRPNLPGAGHPQPPHPLNFQHKPTTANHRPGPPRQHHATMHPTPPVPVPPVPVSFPYRFSPPTVNLTNPTVCLPAAAT